MVYCIKKLRYTCKHKLFLTSYSFATNTIIIEHIYMYQTVKKTNKQGYILCRFILSSFSVSLYSHTYHFSIENLYGLIEYVNLTSISLFFHYRITSYRGYTYEIVKLVNSEFINLYDISKLTLGNYDLDVMLNSYIEVVQIECLVFLYKFNKSKLMSAKYNASCK